jgi:uncharacterized lipoprotein YbaY
MKGILVSASLGVLTLGLSALSSADTLRGEVYYLPRIALPATAKVMVKLVDADDPGVLLDIDRRTDLLRTA